VRKPTHLVLQSNSYCGRIALIIGMYS
jgi:hypothetical protein